MSDLPERVWNLYVEVEPLRPEDYELRQSRRAIGGAAYKLFPKKYKALNQRRTHERHPETSAAWEKANREKRREQAKLTNPPAQARYRERHRSELNEAAKLQRRIDRIERAEKINADRKAWRARNRERLALAARERRAGHRHATRLKSPIPPPSPINSVSAHTSASSRSGESPDSGV